MAQMSILLPLTAKYHLTSSLDLLTELVGFLVSDGVADLLKGPTGELYLNYTCLSQRWSVLLPVLAGWY